MADKIDKKTREWCEAKIYEVMDIMDPTKSNSDHYKQKFAKMNNNEFLKFIAGRTVTMIIEWGRLLYFI